MTSFINDIRSLEKKVWLIVLVAALGYFVDIYDLLLFSIVRVASLKSLGVADDQLLDQGVLLINVQMAGLLIGGLLWGILGDKRGRLSVLFGSIMMYSTANFLNAFVQTVDQYAILRFIAGVGLAGELGAGITLVAEVLPQRMRGFGTALVAGVGLFGAVFAALVGDFFDWRVAYAVGGVLGFLILLLRVGVRESEMFSKIKESTHVRGDFFMIFKSRKSIVKYAAVILAGVPIWFVIGILMTFTPEFSKAFGMVDLPTAGRAVMFSYIGLAIGDFCSGWVSHILQSRRKVIFLYMVGTAVTVVLHFVFARQSVGLYYAFCAALGFFSGYWAMFVTVAAEQFGTNIRSTVTTTVPNFVRASVIPMTFLFQYWIVKYDAVTSGWIVGAIALTTALIALYFLEETFHKDLDYNETV